MRLLRSADVIVLTGPGRSGTSALAAIYAALGFDPGGRWQDEVRAGFEDGEVVGLNRELAPALGMTVEHDLGPFGRIRRRKPGPPRPLDWSRLPAIVDQFGDRLVRAAQNRVVVKDPKLLWTLPVWAAAGAPIEHVTLSIRQPSKSAASRQEMPLATFTATETMSAFTFGLGAAMMAVHEHDIPLSLLRFPQWLDDPEGVYAACRWPRPVSFDRFRTAFAEVVDPGLVRR